MGLLSKAVLGLLGGVALFALMTRGGRKVDVGIRLPPSPRDRDCDRRLALALLRRLVDHRTLGGMERVGETTNDDPRAGVNMPLTQAQRNAVERLAEHMTTAPTYQQPDDTIEVLEVERGALYRYIVSQTGGSTLIKSRPRNWRYSCRDASRWGGLCSSF